MYMYQLAQAAVWLALQTGPEVESFLDVDPILRWQLFLLLSEWMGAVFPSVKYTASRMQKDLPCIVVAVYNARICLFVGTEWHGMSETVPFAGLIDMVSEPLNLCQAHHSHMKHIPYQIFLYTCY